MTYQYAASVRSIILVASFRALFPSYGTTVGQLEDNEENNKHGNAAVSENFKPIHKRNLLSDEYRFKDQPDSDNDYKEEDPDAEE